MLMVGSGSRRQLPAVGCHPNTDVRLEKPNKTYGIKFVKC